MQNNQINTNISPFDFFDSTKISTVVHLNKSTTNPADKLIAVIVTMKSGCSYDNLFRTVKQDSEEGTRVAI